MQTGRKHFSGAISLETILRQTNQNMFFRKPSVVVNKAKHIVGALNLEAWTRQNEKLKNSGTSEADFTSVIEGLRLFEVTPINPFYRGHGFRPETLLTR